MELVSTLKLFDLIIQIKYFHSSEEFQTGDHFFNLKI